MESTHTSTSCAHFSIKHTSIPSNFREDFISLKSHHPHPRRHSNCLTQLLLSVGCANSGVILGALTTGRTQVPTSLNLTRTRAGHTSHKHLKWRPGDLPSVGGSTHQTHFLPLSSTETAARSYFQTGHRTVICRAPYGGSLWTWYELLSLCSARRQQKDYLEPADKHKCGP